MTEDPGYLKLVRALFVHLFSVSRLLVFFGCILLLSSLFGKLPPRPIFSVRLICLGLSWDYFFRIPVAGIHREEYNDGSVQRVPWIKWSRLIGGIFFLGLAAAPVHYWLWIYRHLSS